MEHKQICYFISKRGLRVTQKLKIFNIRKTYLTRETVKEDKCPKYCWPSKSLFKHITVSNILCPTIYCVKQNTVSTLVLNIYLFNFPLSDMKQHCAMIYEQKWGNWIMFAGRFYFTINTENITLSKYLLQIDFRICQYNNWHSNGNTKSILTCQLAVSILTNKKWFIGIHF
jgi:hypothetical protein